jgi:hypothetical protein
MCTPIGAARCLATQFGCQEMILGLALLVRTKARMKTLLGFGSLGSSLGP